MRWLAESLRRRCQSGRVTFSARGLIPLVFAPRVKDSFRSKPGGGPAVISSLARDEAKGTSGVIATETGLLKGSAHEMEKIVR